MLEKLRSWLQARRLKHAALQRAVSAFQTSRADRPMGWHVLSIDDQQSIVRVMYVTDHIPPDRAWFAVPHDGGEVRELQFDDVSKLETMPWR